MTTLVFYPNVNWPCYSYPCVLPLFFPGALDLYLSMPSLLAALPSPTYTSKSHAPVSASLSLTSTGCSLCLSYLLTLHQWFGIELFWRRMLPHSSADKRVGLAGKFGGVGVGGWSSVCGRGFWVEKAAASLGGFPLSKCFKNGYREPLPDLQLTHPSLCLPQIQKNQKD